MQPSKIDPKQWATLCKETLNKLDKIWEEMGLSDEERERQVTSIEESVEQVFLRKLDDEKALVEEYRRLAETLKSEIDELRRDILELVPSNTPDIQVPEAETESLTKTLTWLRGEKDKLEVTKEERLQKVTSMQEKLIEMWDELGEEQVPEFAEIGKKLTIERIEAFEAHLIVVTQQRENRAIALRSACEDICVLFHELELIPETPLDIAISKNSRKINENVSYKLVDIGLTMDIVQQVSQRARELTDEKISRTERIKQLGSQIQPLWELLEVTEDYRTQFFMDNRGLGLAVIQQCEVELEKLLSQKQGKLEELILSAREKIDDLFVQIGQNTKTFREAYHDLLSSDVYNDESLVAHEDLIKALTEQNESLQPILRNIEKYKTLIVDREDYEKLIQDSTRLLSRKRGSLREEELQRKRVTIQLPKLIKSLTAAIESYTETYAPVVEEGKQFVEIMQQTEAEHEQKLAEEKAAKAKKPKTKTPVRNGHSKTPRKARASTKENVVQQ